VSLFVVKLGGEVVAGPELAAIADDVRALEGAGHRVVMVHGGGPQATALQRALGQEPKQIAGRRVTDEAALDVMKMVVAGKVNVDLCGALVRAGVRPLGLHGASGRVIVATKRPAKVYAGAGPEPVDLGLVGDVTRVDTAFLERVLALGLVPVLACLGVGDDGQAYNINADIVANQLASALGGVGADAGDRRPPACCATSRIPSSRLRTLTVAEARAAIARRHRDRRHDPQARGVDRRAGRRPSRRHPHRGRDRCRRSGPRARRPGAVGTALLP
jgi:acetylglutamate kinase